MNHKPLYRIGLDCSKCRFVFQSLLSFLYFLYSPSLVALFDTPLHVLCIISIKNLPFPKEAERHHYVFYNCLKLLSVHTLLLPSYYLVHTYIGICQDTPLCY